MKNKNIFVSFILVFALLGFIQTAKAEIEVKGGLNAGADINVGKSSNSAKVESETDMSIKENDSDEVEDSSKDEDKTEVEDNNGNEVSAAHRSTVANVVLKLKELASKNKGIGAEVSAVAQAQSDSNDNSTEAMKKVENRSGFKTFWIGTDYKSMGQLRSGIVTTNNNIDRLTKVLEKETNPEIKAQLDIEIKALQAEKIKMEAFIKAYEGKFSMFGWFAKIFVK